MSHSIHETRSMLRKSLREQWDDEEARSSHKAEWKARLGTKHHLKHQEKRRRVLSRSEPMARDCTSVAIPIILEPVPANVRFSVTPDDLQAIMQRLPDTAAGLARIELCLGQIDAAMDEVLFEPPEPDPWIGRLGGEILPGIWAGTSTTYYYDAGPLIRLTGFVYAPQIDHRAAKDFYLKLHVLGAFVGMLAWHECRLHRPNQWAPLDENARQAMARRLAYDWLRSVLVPYMEQAYPQETRGYIDWIAHYGGTRLALETLVGDPRKPCGLFSVLPVQRFLFDWVEEGLNRDDSRYRFGDFLHMCGYLDEAMQIIDALLIEFPEEPACLRLKAHILYDQRQDLASYELAQRLVAMEPDYPDAWDALADAAERLERWETVVSAITRAFELLEDDPEPDSLRLQRIRANIALGNLTAAERDIEVFEKDECDYWHERVVQYRLQLERERAS